MQKCDFNKVAKQSNNVVKNTSLRKKRHNKLIVSYCSIDDGL